MLPFLPPMMGLIVSIFVSTISIYIAGKILAEKENIGIAFVTALIGSLVAYVIGMYVPYVGWLIAIIAWLAIIKHFYDTSWLKAFFIALIAFIAEVIIAGILALIGLGAWIAIFKL